MTSESGKGLRSCIVCGRQARKGDLLRIVRPSEAPVSFDVTGRVPGRGAYLCSSTCFNAACRTGKLGRALRCRLSEQDYERIADEMKASGVRCTKED